MIFDAATKEPLFGHCKYICADVAFEENREFIMAVAQMCADVDVKLEAMHLEYVPGQFEFITLPLLGIQSADNQFKFTEALRRVAIKHEKLATFMTLPFADSLGANGCHFNHSLRSVLGNQPVMYDDSKENKLSEVCTQWIAGILKHIDALTALCCPTVNCYRRFTKEFAPSKSDWEIDDRHVTIRVKNTTPGSCYVESRLPSSAANPYIVTAATVAAGIDGITNQLQCPPPRSAGGKGKQLPTTLVAALDALRNDNVIQEALGSEFISWFTEMKKQEIQILGGGDVLDVSEEMFEKERKLYMDLL